MKATGHIVGAHARVRFATGAAFAASFVATADAAIIPSWRINPISAAAITEAPVLSTATSVSLMVQLSGGSQFNVAGLDLDGAFNALDPTASTNIVRYFHRIGGGASFEHTDAPSADDIGAAPALAFDTYVRTCVQGAAAAAPGRMNGVGAAQIGTSNFVPATGAHRTGQFFNVAWGATPNNGSNGLFEIARITMLGVVPGSTLIPGQFGFVRDSLNPNTNVLLPAIPVTINTDRYYVGPNGGIWNNSSNWSGTSGGAGGASVPTSGARAFLISSISKQVNYDLNIGQPGLSFLAIDATAGAVMTLAQAANAMSCDAEVVGMGGIGVHHQTGGSNLVTGSLQLGQSTNASGSYRLNGGTLTAGSEFVGVSGVGTFEQTGGTNTITAGPTANGLVIASGVAGTFLLSGGTLDCNANLQVGSAGFGTFGQSSGRLINGTSMNLGLTGGSRGRYELSGTGVAATPVMNVGLSIGVGPGTGAVAQTGGSLTVGFDMNIANGAATSGSVTIGAGSFLAGSVYVGGNSAAPGGTGSFAVNGGTASIAGTLRAWSNGTILYNGGALNVTGLLDLNGGYLTESANGARLLRAGALSITAGGVVDLNDNDMVVGSATSKASIENHVRLARNGGGWNMPGINSSAAKTHPQQATTLGVLSGSEYIPLNGNVFSGQTVTSSDTLVKYTWYGDTDFNGIVDFDDYVRADGGFNGNLTGWLNGDFDLSGTIDFDDYVLIDLGFNAQNGTLHRAQAYLSGDDRTMNGMSDDPALRMVADHVADFGTDYAVHFLAAVPEPGLVLAVCAGVLLIGRRRSRLASKQGERP